MRSLAALSVIVVIAMHVSGIFAAARLSYTRCMGWPIWQLIDTDLHPWLQTVRLGLAGLAAVLVITTVWVAARSERLRPWGVVIASLFAAEMVLGLVIRSGGMNAAVAAAYSVLAVSLLSALGLLMAVAWTAQVGADVTSRQPPAPSRVTAEPGGAEAQPLLRSIASRRDRVVSRRAACARRLGQQIGGRADRTGELTGRIAEVGYDGLGPL